MRSGTSREISQLRSSLRVQWWSVAADLWARRRRRAVNWLRNRRPRRHLLSVIVADSSSPPGRNGVPAWSWRAVKMPWPRRERPSPLTSPTRRPSTSTINAALRTVTTRNGAITQRHLHRHASTRRLARARLLLTCCAWTTGSCTLASRRVSWPTSRRSWASRPSPRRTGPRSTDGTCRGPLPQVHQSVPSVLMFDCHYACSALQLHSRFIVPYAANRATQCSLHMFFSSALIKQCPRDRIKQRKAAKCERETRRKTPWHCTAQPPPIVT